MWKLHAIRFAVFALIALTGSAINSAYAPQPTAAHPAPVEIAQPDCETCETSMQSLEAKNRWTADGKYIGDGRRQPPTVAAVKAKPHKAKPHKAKLHHKVKHHPKAKKPVHHSTRHHRITHHGATVGHVSKAHSAKGHTMRVITGRAPLKLFAGQLGTSGRRTPLERVNQREASRKHRRHIEEVAARAEPTVVSYSVRTKIATAQDRANTNASGRERSTHLDRLIGLER